MSRTLTESARYYSAIEKEVTAIIKAVRKWAHFLHARTFIVVTAQLSIAFKLDQQKETKLKTPKSNSGVLNSEPLHIRTFTTDQD